MVAFTLPDTIPLTIYGDLDGFVKYDINFIPKFNSIKKTPTTKIRKTNLAIIEFEFKNSLPAFPTLDDEKLSIELLILFFILDNESVIPEIIPFPVAAAF
jgi:hypothetical protein